MSPSKKLSLHRVVLETKPDIIVLQDTFGIGELVKSSLESSLGGWTFQALDVCGCSGGLAVGWLDRSCRCENIWGFESVMELDI